jgi:hypothetical protein
MVRIHARQPVDYQFVTTTTRLTRKVWFAACLPLLRRNGRRQNVFWGAHPGGLWALSFERRSIGCAFLRKLPGESNALRIRFKKTGKSTAFSPSVGGRTLSLRGARPAMTTPPLGLRRCHPGVESASPRRLVHEISLAFIGRRSAPELDRACFPRAESMLDVGLASRQPAPN